MLKKFFQAAFTGLLISLSVVAFGIPANAANVSPSMTISPSALPTSGTNAQAITVTVISSTQLGPAPNTAGYQLKLPTGWSWVSPGFGQTCPNGINFSPTGYQACDTSSTPGALTVMWGSSDTVAAGTTITATIPAGAVNLGNGRQFEVNLTRSQTSADQGFISVGDSTSSQTVTFDANGGTGTMNPQTGSTSTALTTNTFTKAGFTFGGWATSQANATAGTVAYTDGAPYAFTSSTTLYAIWTTSGGGSNGSSSNGSASSLANTGSSMADVGIAAISLGLLGAALVLARRKSQV